MIDDLMILGEVYMYLQRGQGIHVVKTARCDYIW
jgi:hypothetical protein